MVKSLGRQGLAGRATRRLALTAACTAVAMAGATSAVGATVTKNSLIDGISGFPTAAGGLGVFEPGPLGDPPDAVREVGPYSVDVVANILAEAPYGGSWRAYAVTDVKYHTDNAVPYDMELQLAADAWAGEFTADVPARLIWLLRNADALVAAETDRSRAAAAIQVVVWQTLRNPPVLEPRADLTQPTDDALVNALAVKFTGLMDANYTATATPVGVTTTGSTGCTSTVTITGAPGTVVGLAADGGGVLGASSVTIGPDGTASTTVTAPAGVTVTVTASSTTGGVLVRADGVHEPDNHVTQTHKTQAPEELIFLAGAQATVAAAQAACSSPPPPPGTTPVGTPAGKLRVTKTGPATATAGQVVTYRLRVSNPGPSLVSGVTLRDILPGGMSLVNRPGGSRIKNGSVTWSIPSLASGASRTVSVRVRISRTASGRRCNTATASAGNAATVRSTSCTSIRAVAGATRIPAVTG